MESLSQLAMVAVAAVVFLLVITLLVAVHELGHFLAAKAFGMHVEAFAVMMGGRRRTDLSNRLKEPLVPSWIVWLVALGCLAVLVATSMMGMDKAYLVALTALSIGIPIWVASRIGALYHLAMGQWGKTLAFSWIAGIGVLFMATRFQNMAAGQLLAIFGMASAIALLVLYYHPMLKKAEDAPMGEGFVKVDGQDVPVAFRPLWSRKSKVGTEFSLLLVPAGGFASIKGMQPKPDGSEIHVQGGFYSKPPWQRLVVLFAGPLFSVGLGVLIFTFLYSTIGMYRPSNSPEVTDVIRGSAADKAGLKKGDLFVEVEGKPVTTFFDVLKVIRDRPDQDVPVKVKRGEQVLSLTVRPEKSDSPVPVLGPDLMPTTETAVQGRMGIPIGREAVQMGLWSAFKEANNAPVQMVVGLAGIAKKPSSASEQVGGPGTIAIFAFEATKDGIISILALAAGLSISLGIMNLLPIPPLDGGQMAVAFVEMLRGGRRLSMQVQSAVSNIGFMLVMLLVVSVLAVDVGRIIGKKPDNPPQKEATSESRPAR